MSLGKRHGFNRLDGDEDNSWRGCGGSNASDDLEHLEEAGDVSQDLQDDVEFDLHASADDVEVDLHVSTSSTSEVLEVEPLDIGGDDEDGFLGQGPFHPQLLVGGNKGWRTNKWFRRALISSPVAIVIILVAVFVDHGPGIVCTTRHGFPTPKANMNSCEGWKGKWKEGTGGTAYTTSTFAVKNKVQMWVCPTSNKRIILLYSSWAGALHFHITTATVLVWGSGGRNKRGHIFKS
jgi:hypothetical protein